MTDPRELTELKIYRGGEFAGVLRRTQLGCELEIDSQFLKNSQYSELTYRIKKEPRIYQQAGVNLPPFFAGLLPEGLRLKTLVSELKTSEDDLFTLLAASGEHSVGDVYTVAPGRSPSSQAELPSVNQVDFYQFFRDNLTRALTEKGGENLPGVQEKISASMISFPVRAVKKNKSYILKLNPKDKPNLVYNESQCLKLAEKCGLKVNAAKIVYDKNKNPGLLVERFDRVASGNNQIVKVHQEDACQFLDRYPADKYRLSFQEICTGIQELSTAPTLEVLQVLQLYIFSYVIGNGDLHAKNISLQTDVKTGRIQLTPAYDLICTYIYKDHKMALKLDGRDSNFQRRYFIEFGIRFGLNQKVIENLIDKLLGRLKKHQHLLFEIPSLSQNQESQLKDLLTARAKALSST